MVAVESMKQQKAFRHLKYRFSLNIGRNNSHFGLVGVSPELTDACMGCIFYVWNKLFPDLMCY